MAPEHDQHQLLSQIRSSYDDHPGFRHEFWDWFAQADLELGDLRRFALAYYQHVLRFRLYVAGALTVAPREALQVALSEILADEYGVHIAGRPASDSHPEMFRKFMRSLGLSEADWEGSTPLPGIQRFFDMHFALFRGALVSESIGAVAFGMESTTPYRHGRVVDALGKYEEKHDTKLDDTFFASHIEVDEHHSDILFETAAPIFASDREGVERGARLSFDARKIFLDDLLRHMTAH